LTVGIISYFKTVLYAAVKAPDTTGTLEVSSYLSPKQ